MILSETCLADKQESDLGPLAPNEKLGVVICTCNPHPGKVETEGSLECTSQLSIGSG